MFISLISLIFLSIISGFLFNDIFIGYGSLMWNNIIYIFNYHFNFIDIEYIHPLIKNLPILLCLIIIISINYLFISINNINNLFIYKNLYIIYLNFFFFFYYALFFDNFYNRIYNYILKYSYLISTKYMDKGILELIGPFGLYKLFRFLFNKTQNFIFPLIFYYLFIFFLCLVIIIIIIFFIYYVNINFFTNNLRLIIILNFILFYY
jgi:NADH-ubiquinone oxidoreductase chain 5